MTPIDQGSDYWEQSGTIWTRHRNVFHTELYDPSADMSRAPIYTPSSTCASLTRTPPLATTTTTTSTP